jgi:hypothetical protein
MSNLGAVREVVLSVLLNCDVGTVVSGVQSMSKQDSRRFRSWANVGNRDSIQLDLAGIQLIAGNLGKVAVPARCDAHIVPAVGVASVTFATVQCAMADSYRPVSSDPL